MRSRLLLVLLASLPLVLPVAAAQEENVTASFAIPCPDINALKSFFAVTASFLLVFPIAFIMLSAFLSLFGESSRVIEFIANSVMRMGPGSVVPLIILYVLMFWNFDKAFVTTGGGAGCAYPDINILMTQGPLFFRFVGYVLHVFGFM